MAGVFVPQQQQFDYEMNDNSHENKENFFYEEESDKFSWSEKASSASTSDINSLDDDVLIKDFKEFIKKNLTGKSEKPKSSNNRQVSLQSILELNQISEIDIQQIGFEPNQEKNAEQASPEILLKEIYTVCNLLTQLSKERLDLLQIIPAGPQVSTGDYWERIGPLAGNLQMLLMELSQIIKQETLNSVNCVKSAHLCCIANGIAFISDHKNVSGLMGQAERLLQLLVDGTLEQLITTVKDSKNIIKMVTTDLWSLKSLIFFHRQNASMNASGMIW